MKITFPWDTARRIRALENTSNRTPQQEERLRKLHQSYSTGKTGYYPPLTYPTTNTRARREDTFFKTREEQRRVFPVSTDINTVYNINSIIRNPIVMRMYPQEPGEYENAYRNRLRRIIEAKHRPQNLNNPTVVYNPDPASPYFASGKMKRSLGRSYVSLDIETDDYGHPISISALKFQYDKNQKKFISVDNYQRYYQAHGWNLRSTEAVHGFTPSILKDLRRQQGADYGKTYKGQEIEDLRSFLGTSVIVGHNIQQFDLDMLFPDRVIQNSTIDTLAAARNAWKGKKNDLDSVFQRVYGKTMEQAGLSHHDANADTIASMMILEALHKDPGRVGEAIRYVMGSKGHRQLVGYDEYLDSMVTKGSYKSTYAGKGGKRRLNEVYMTAEEMGLKKNGKMVEGFSEVDLSKQDPNNMDDEVLMKSAMADYIKYVKDTDNDYKETMKASSLSNDLEGQLSIYNRYQQLRLIEKVAAAKSTEMEEAIMASANYGAKAVGRDTILSMAKEIRTAKEAEEWKEQKERIELDNWRSEVRDLNLRDEYSFDRNDALRKMRYLDRAERKGQIWGGDRAKLDNLVGSYDDLVDATERVIDANQKLMKIYEAIGKIRPYDVNQYIASAKGQWSGTMGASRGVIPSFIRNPISRLGEATFNVIDRSVSPWNAVQRTWNSGIGTALTGALTAGLGPVGLGIGMGLTGAVNAGTQVFGNYQQAKMEMSMLNIQNNLNTLGALISWISTPFQLLHKATKLLIGSFGGLTYKLNSLMAGGIGEMSQMGNPLEQMTGVDYLKYQGTTLMDLASLQSKGSTNAAIESFATMQRNLYRFGRVDTDKLLAANMLGVFNEAFTPTTDAVGSYYAMGNKILSNMQGQSASQQADTLYYVNQLNSGLAQTIRSALMMGVTDLRQLTDPSAFHQMYWRPITDTEEGAFRKTQYEYGVAGQQFGYTKMRFADKIWNAIGRDLYNGLNRLVDNAAEGDWKGVLEAAGDMWTTFKEKVKSVWDSLNAEGGIGDKISAGLSVAWDKIKEWGVNIARGIIDIWNQVFRTVLEKAQGLIAYLSTVQVKLVRGENGWGIDISTIKDAKGLGGEIYNGSANSMTGLHVIKGANKGMEGLAALVDTVFPGMSDVEKSLMTRESLAEKLRHLPGVIKDGVLTTPSLDLPQYNIHGLNLGENPELIDPLLDYLAMYESSGSGLREQAAAMLSPLLRPYLGEDATSIPGLMSTYDKFVDAQNEVLGTAASYIAAPKGDGDTKITFDFKLGDKTATATYTQGKGLTFTGMPLLQQVGLGNGISVSVSKQR